MNINELKSLNERERIEFFVFAKSADLKTILKNERYKGYSKLNKKQALSIIMNMLFDVEEEKNEESVEEIKEENNKEEVTLTTIEEIEEENNKEEVTLTTIEEIEGDVETWALELMDFSIGYFDVIPNSDYDIEDYIKKLSETKTKYRKMVKYFHPDNKDTGDSEIFKMIQESYEDSKLRNDDYLKYLKDTEGLTMRERILHAFE